MPGDDGPFSRGPVVRIVSEAYEGDPIFKLKMATQVGIWIYLGGF